jgi:cytidine deaminase
MTDPKLSELAAAACRARSGAYVPYSGFPVGAAVLTETGTVVTGCNVENASYGLTLCAERVAVFRAVAEGCREFRALAIASSGGAAPCGACRQVLAEFCDDMVVLLIDVNAPDSVRMTSLAELLPERFDRRAIGERPG